MKKIFTLRFLTILFVILSVASSIYAQSYCNPTFSEPCFTGFYNTPYISSVQLGALSNTTPDCTVNNFTTTPGDTADAIAGASSTMSVGENGGYFYDYLGIGIYIDFNSDGDFDDAGELVYSDLNYSSPYTYNFSLSIPSNIPTGYYRMRVLAVTDFPTDGMACSNQYYFEGDYQDYTLNITGSGCDPIISVQPLPATRCAGQADTFSVSAIGTNLTYQWMFNNVPIFSSTNPTLILTNIDSSMAGIYSCVVKNSLCAGTGDTSDEAALTVNALPVIYNAGPTAFCPGGSVVLTSSASFGNQWRLNGTNIFNATNQTYTATVPGTYSVVYTNNCPSISLFDTISNYPSPNPVISPAGIGGIVRLCSGSTQLFSTTTDPGWSYQWALNGVDINGATGTTYNATAGGLYVMTSTNSYGCTTASSAVELQINLPSTTSITNVGSDLLCAGGYKTLFANSSDPAATYQWQYNGVDIPGATNVSYNAYNDGNYSVISYNGCYVTSSAIYLSTLTFPTITATGPTTFCAGNNVMLISSLTDTTGVHFQWMRNGNDITNANGHSYTVTDSGVYSFLVVVDSSCTATSSPQTVTVYPAPMPVIVPTGNNNLTLNTTEVYNTYQWYMGSTASNGSELSGEINFSYQVTTTGYYSLRVTDYNGCSGMSSPILVTVTIDNTGVKPSVNYNELIRLYPNPVTSLLHISAPMHVNVSVSAIDGRVILQQNEATEMNMSDLADGMYIIRVSDKYGNLLKVDKVTKN